MNSRKFNDKSFFLEKFDLRFDLDPCEYVEIEEEFESVRCSFNSLEEEIRNLIYNHVIKKEPLCNYALRNDVELEDIDVIYKNAIVLLKEIFMDNYYKKAKICS